MSQIFNTVNKSLLVFFNGVGSLTERVDIILKICVHLGEKSQAFYSGSSHIICFALLVLLKIRKAAK